MQKSPYSFLSSENQQKSIDLLKSVAFIVAFILSLVIVSKIGMMFSIITPGLYYGISGTLGALLVAFVFVRLEKRPLAVIGLQWEKQTPLRFLYGVLTGIGLFLFVVGIICFTASLRLQFTKTVNYTAILFHLIPVFFLALMEEIGFRTFPLVKLEKSYGIITTQCILALLFAGYHMLNGWGIAISFMGPFIWSFVFGLSASWSGGIAMSTGIHFSLNVMQGLAGLKSENFSVFNIIEKNKPAQALLSSQSAGIFAHVLVLLGAVGITIWYNRRKQNSSC